MTIWILALILVASAIGLGYKQGAIRAAFSFIGIVFAALLATTFGKLFKWLLPHLGVHDDILIWAISPILGFVLILFLIKFAAFFVHHKIEMYYKYKAGDLRLALWERMNHRVGACIGPLNGLAYVVLISFAIFNLSYWTVQIAPGNEESRKIRLANQLGHDLESTGMSKVGKAVAPMPDNYYKTADLAGLICQNPQITSRLANYPPFLSLLERDDLKPLVENSELTNAWHNHEPIGKVISLDPIKNILKDNDLKNLLYGVVTTNLDDLTAYLQSGQSAKYDPEKILGRWDFNVGVSLAMLRQARPNLPPREYAITRVIWNTNYARTTFIAGSDGQAFMKDWPTFKNSPGQPPQTQGMKGQWTAGTMDYSIQLDNKTYLATTDGARLTLKEGKNVFVFDRE